MAAPDPARLPAARATLRKAGVEVLLEDNHLLVVAKPAGLLSQSDGSGDADLVALLAAYRQQAEGKAGAAFVGLVHRLDRNVSGVVLCAKTSKAAARMAALFRERDARLEKHYLAWVVGLPATDEGRLEARLARSGRTTHVAAPGEEDDAGRAAVLDYAVRGRGPRAARLAVRLHTGVTHQVRAQLSAAGHPLHGDPKYGGPAGARVALHAWRLVFPHPVGGAPHAATAPVPAALRALDRRLRIQPPVTTRHG
ncbi:MAG: RluA family pseudouridine synthase [Planctomycetia bacterium]